MKRPATVTLRSVQFFRDLPEQTLQEISMKCELRAYKPNMLVMSQNAIADKVGLIISGFVKLMRGDRQSTPILTDPLSSNISDKRMLVDLLGPGESIGAASTLLGDRYSSSAITLTPCHIVFIKGDSFITLLHEIDGLSQKVMNSLAKSLIASEKHTQLMNGDLKTRVFSIRQRCAQLGVDVDRWLSNAEVARMAGATRVAVSQIMNRQRRGSQELQ